MKKNNLRRRIELTIAAVSQYWSTHAAIAEATKKMYIKEYQDEKANGKVSIEIRILQCGNLYYVSQCFYLDGTYFQDASWRAAYSWNTGCLLSIGGCRTLFFDLMDKKLYLQETDDSGTETVDCYRQMQIKSA